MKKFAKRAISLLCAMALAVGCAGCSGAQKTAEVTQIMIWTYYNGDQLESFNQLVETFNDTVGKEKNIRVETESQGSVNDLEASVMDSAEGKVGAAALPNIFSAYSDTAYAVDQMGLLVDLSQYLTADEQAQFIEGYRTEGDFDGSCSSSTTRTGSPLPRPPVPLMKIFLRWKVWCRPRRCTTTGRTLRPRPPMTAGRCLAATPWRTI